MVSHHISVDSIFIDGVENKQLFICNYYIYTEEKIGSAGDIG